MASTSTVETAVIEVVDVEMGVRVFVTVDVASTSVSGQVAVDVTQTVGVLPSVTVL